MSRRARTALLPLWLAAAAVTGLGCDVRAGEGGFSLGMASGRATDEWKRTYTISPDGRFEVRNTNGTVTVEQGTGVDTVEVRAERIAKASSDEAAQSVLKQIEISEDVRPDVVRLETKAPQSWRKNHEVRYFIKVPKSIKVEARTTNGGVRLNGIANEVIASSQNGGIKGDGLSGHVDANTTNGGVEIGLEALADDGVRLETVNGGVQLQLPKTAKADISARCVNGGVHVDEQLTLESTGEKSRRRLEGRLNGGGSRVELATTNGGIHITGR
jgi:Putative adhesin